VLCACNARGATIRAGGSKGMIDCSCGGSGRKRGVADNTAIEWTDATWNPVTGCTKISPGCDYCYASRLSERFRNVPGHPFESGFDLTLRPGRLDQPLAWTRRRMIFVNSMSDLFHKQIPRSYISAVFETMEKADWHIFQILMSRAMENCPLGVTRNCPLLG